MIEGGKGKKDREKVEKREVGTTGVKEREMRGRKEIKKKRRSVEKGRRGEKVM